MFAASKTDGVVAGGPPPSGDPYWSNVSLLTNFENNLTFRDESTNNFAITRNGVVNPSLRTPFSGGVGGSEYFNGVSGSYLSVPRNSAFLPVANEDFTIEAWVYLTATPSVDAQIMTLGEYGTDVDWGLNISSSLIVGFYIGATIFNYTNTTALTLNTWNHVAVSRSGTGTNNLKVFVNGVGTSFTTNSTTVGTGNRALTIGADQNGDESRLTGFLSNLRIVKSTAVYTANFTPPTAPLTAITNTSLLITGTGQGMFNNATFVDQGPNALTVTATGAPVYSGRSPFGNTYPGSVLFSGTTQTLTTPSSNAFAYGTGDFTWEMWIYPTSATWTSVSGNFYMLDHGLNGGALIYVANRLAYYNPTTNTGSALYTSGGTIAANTWTHIAASRASGTTRLYINGTLTTSGADSHSFAASVVSLAQYGGALAYYQGHISNARLVKGTAVYTANFTPSTTPLTAITNTSLLVRGDTGAFYDLSNNGVVINQTGSPAVTTQIKKFGNESGVFSATNFYTTAVNSSAFSFGTGDFTIEGWVYFTTLSTNNPVFDISTGGASPTHQIVLDFRTGASTSKMFGYIDGVSAASTTTTVATGTWYYVALTRSGTTVRGFLNGTQELTFTSSANLSGSYFVGIGQYVAGVGNDAGYLDDLRITKGVARYTANFTPPTATFPTN